MKTWKQGNLGRFVIQDSRILFLKCLKYPLAAIFESYNKESGKLENELFHVFIELGEFRKIEIIGFEKLSAKEKSLGEYFSMQYYSGTSNILKIEKKTGKDNTVLQNMDIDSICTIEEIGNRYFALKRK